MNSYIEKSVSDSNLISLNRNNGDANETNKNNSDLEETNSDSNLINDLNINSPSNSSTASSNSTINTNNNNKRSLSPNHVASSIPSKKHKDMSVSIFFI